MGNCQWFTILKDKYAYLPGKRSPFRSTAFSNSNSRGDQISGGYTDRKLSFVPLLTYVKKKGLKVLNILKVIRNIEWGAALIDLYNCVWVSIFRRKVNILLFSIITYIYECIRAVRIMRKVNCQRISNVTYQSLIDN